MMAFYRGAKIANFKKRGRKKMDRFFYLIKQSFFFLSDILQDNKLNDKRP